MLQILMPSLSDSMEQGLILQWLVADGDEVAVGQELCEIETDKATMTYQSEVAGSLQIIAAQDSTVAVGELIATVADTDRDTDTDTDNDGNPSPAPAASRTTAPSSPSTRVTGHDQADGVVAATPIARRLAAAHGLAIGAVRGTGPGGRITKSDVLAAVGITATSPVEVPRPSADLRSDRSDRVPRPDGRDGAAKVEEPTRLQQVIARRMSEAKSTIPHFQVQTEVSFDAAIAFRAELKAAAAAFEDVAPPSLNDLIVKASALALRRHPQANASYRDGHFELHEHVNVGVAVAADGALVVPTVSDADTKSLGTIAAETRALAARVRDGAIAPGELSGATFTVSNLGMFGMTAIIPVVNPPQAAILGAARATLARDPETAEIIDRRLLTLTLSCDHRILYGADASRFLADIRALLQAPVLLAV